MEKQGIRLFNTLKWVSLPGDTIVKGYEGNHLPQLGATDLFTQEAKITAAEPQVPAVKHARIPCTRHRGWCGWQWMAQLAIKQLMDCCYHALQKNKHISEPFEISNNGKEMKTSEDHIHVPYTRWAPPRVYVTTSFFIPCLGKQSEPKLQAKVRRSKNLTSALQKLRIGSVLNVLGLGSPLGGCGPLSKRIWSGHILAKALSNFSDCQAPLNRQQTLRKTYCRERSTSVGRNSFVLSKYFGNALEMLQGRSPQARRQEEASGALSSCNSAAPRCSIHLDFRVEPNGVCMCSNARCLKTRKRLPDHLGSVYSLNVFEGHKDLKDLIEAPEAAPN